MADKKKKKPGTGELRRLDEARMRMQDEDNPNIYYGGDFFPERASDLDEATNSEFLISDWEEGLAGVGDGRHVGRKVKQVQGAREAMDYAISRAEADAAKAPANREAVTAGIDAIARKEGVSPKDIKKAIKDLRMPPAIGGHKTVKGVYTPATIATPWVNPAVNTGPADTFEHPTEAAITAAHEIEHSRGKNHNLTAGHLLSSNFGDSTATIQANRKVIQELRDRGIPDEWITRALLDERLDPEGDPTGKGLWHAFLYGDGKKPFKDRYKYESDFEAKAPDFIDSRRIPSPVRRKPK